MSRNTIDLNFADGIYLFALPLERIDELQRKTGVGIGGLFSRVLKGCSIDENNAIFQSPKSAEFYAGDVVETIRQGLIGGGKGIVNGTEIVVTPTLANKLVENYVLCRPLMEGWDVAANILGACIIGYEPPKKDQPANERAPGKAAAKKRAGSTTP
jgi:hypothetical protein